MVIVSRALLLLGALHSATSDLRLVVGIWMAGETPLTRLLFRNKTDDFTMAPLKTNNGLLRLTNDGVKEMYELGLWLKERYVTNSPFASESIQRDETVVESSAHPAALESAEAVVEGLFCKNDCNSSHSDITYSWSPFAIYPSRMRGPDLLLDPPPFNCKEYIRAIAIENAELIRRSNSATQAWYRKIAEYLGNKEFTGQNITNGINVRQLIRQIPNTKWLSDSINGTTTLQWIQKVNKQHFLSSVNSNEKVRMIAGALLNDLISTIEDIAFSSERMLKARFLSTNNQRLLLALKYAMGIEITDVAPPGSVLIVEVHDRKDAEHTVEIYSRTRGDRVTQHKIMDCSHRCPLSRFLSNVKSMSVTQEKLHLICSSTYHAPSFVVIVGLLLHVCT
ncbi:hypothetical protein Q1695_007150 [Nippostrongylus brasiliensis]|nr:hypothetical protein Q1695_007150 [Nippostrongylus brasiliensis]